MGGADHVDGVFRKLTPQPPLGWVERSKSPFPLAGKGLGMGVSAQGSQARRTPKAPTGKVGVSAPTPNPSPQGGGESFGNLPGRFRGNFPYIGFSPATVTR
jgi:hypothetical protein